MMFLNSNNDDNTVTCRIFCLYAPEMKKKEPVFDFFCLLFTVCKKERFFFEFWRTILVLGLPFQMTSHLRCFCLLESLTKHQFYIRRQSLNIFTAGGKTEG